MSTSKRAQFTSNPGGRVHRRGAISARGGYKYVLFAQCLGLTVACAQGQQLDGRPVPFIVTPDAAVTEEGAGGDMGSGGRVESGTGGVVASGSGGAPRGSGGSSAGGTPQGKGGGSAAGAGGASGAGGAVGAGGKAASGGAASGGAQSSGGSAGSASGGRASGGASGGGAGGSAGASGGSAGAQNCPGYVDDDACSRCICQKCAPQVAACVNTSDTTKNQQCKAIQDCAETKHCASDACYCVPTLANGFCAQPDGPCVAPILAVAGQNATAVQVQTLGNDTSNPIGRAKAIGTCTVSNCKSECQIP